jgi:hypothetical protein
MRFLPSEDQVVVDRALALGLNGAVPAPAYLSPQLCTALSFLLAVPTLGFSLVFDSYPLGCSARPNQTPNHGLAQAARKR